jgi:hypothetical protein
VLSNASETTKKREKRLTSDGHEVLGQRHPNLALGVLLLEDAVIAPVIGRLVRPDRVQQLVLGAPAVPPAVGEEDCSPPHPEQAVWNHHGPTEEARAVAVNGMTWEDAQAMLLSIELWRTCAGKKKKCIKWKTDHEGSEKR